MIVWMNFWPFEKHYCIFIQIFKKMLHTSRIDNKCTKYYMVIRWAIRIWRNTLFVFVLTEMFVVSWSTRILWSKAYKWHINRYIFWCNRKKFCLKDISPRRSPSPVQIRKYTVLIPNCVPHLRNGRGRMVEIF